MDNKDAMIKREKSTKERNYSIDLVRIIAIFSVISVHFFLNCQYYTVPLQGKKLFVMSIIRAGFMVCVPLFIVITGFLMNKKTLCKKYYKGIIKTISIYLLASIVCLLFRTKYLQEEYSIKESILAILKFNASEYAWYVEMYIGLFLLIPFLNLIYNNLEGKKQKIALIGTLIFLTALPGVINIFKIEISEWWRRPSGNLEYDKIIPDWWKNIYPFTYYFIGCYFCEFKPKINKILNLILLAISIVIYGAFTYYRSYESTFVLGEWHFWGALPIVIMTILTFLLVYSINLNDISKSAKFVLKTISNLAFGAYLVSFIFDQLFYKILNENVLDVGEKMKYYFIIVPVIFILSMLLSGFLNMVYYLCWKLCSKIQLYTKNEWN